MFEKMSSGIVSMCDKFASADAVSIPLDCSSSPACGAIILYTPQLLFL
jgi:hypothetical protein